MSDMKSKSKALLTHRELLEVARAMLGAGSDWEAVLPELRRLGASPIGSIKVVRILKGVSLREAKEVVHFSAAWTDRREAHEQVHAQALGAVAIFRSPHESMFEIGDAVRIEDRETLERFRAEWMFHNPLSDEQIAYAGRSATVRKVGFYHGGDELYELDGIPGVWHLPNLSEP